MSKEDKRIETSVTTREAWLIWQALEKELTAARDERAWRYAWITMEIMKLAEGFKSIWQDNA